MDLAGGTGVGSAALGMCRMKDTGPRALRNSLSPLCSLARSPDQGCSQLTRDKPSRPSNAAGVVGTKDAAEMPGVRGDEQSVGTGADAAWHLG